MDIRVHHPRVLLERCGQMVDTGFGRGSEKNTWYRFVYRGGRSFSAIGFTYFRSCEQPALGRQEVQILVRRVRHLQQD